MARNQRLLGYVFLFALLFLGIYLLYVMDSGPISVSMGVSREWQRRYYGLHSYQNRAMESVELEMRKRKYNVKRMCHRLRSNAHSVDHAQLPESNRLDHVIVDDHYRLLYCYVPKVACTNWKRVLLILQAKARSESNGSTDPLAIPANDSHRQNRFRTLDSYGHAEAQYRLRHYYKFLFVRHPFERLLSAFRNKFQANYSTYFQQRFGRLIVQRHRRNASQEALLRGHDVSFAEFAAYLLDERTRADGALNEHWRPVAQLCQPCRVHYDAVGRYEELEADAAYVLSRGLGVGGLVRFPRINRTVDTLGLVHDYFANLTRAHVRRLYHMYSLDFKMFGYKYDVT